MLFNKNCLSTNEMIIISAPTNKSVVFEITFSVFQCVYTVVVLCHYFRCLVCDSLSLFQKINRAVNKAGSNGILFLLPNQAIQMVSSFQTIHLLKNIYKITIFKQKPRTCTLS